jgi:hypothetical protein
LKNARETTSLLCSLREKNYRRCASLEECEIDKNGVLAVTEGQSDKNMKDIFFYWTAVTWDLKA